VVTVKTWNVVQVHSKGCPGMRGCTLAWARDDTRWAQTMDVALALWVDEVASRGQGHIMAREEEGKYSKIDGTSHECNVS
jgi:hypothetical protein